MNQLEALNNNIKNSSLWSPVLGAACLITATALLILGLHSIQAHHLSLSHSSYNTLAIFDLKKTAIYLAGSGAAFGISFFIMKRLVTKKLLPDLKKDENNIKLEKAMNAGRIMHRILAVIAMLGGLALILCSTHVISALPHQNIIIDGTRQISTAYVANAQKLNALLGAIAIGGFLFSWGVLETARHMSNKP